MKPLSILLLFLSLSINCFSGTKDTYKKLCEVNKCWKEQADINKEQLPVYKQYSEQEWIRIHLQLVEQTLRAKSTQHLTAT